MDVVGEGVWEHELTSSLNASRAWHSPRCHELLGADLADEPSAIRTRVDPPDLARWDALCGAATRAPGHTVDGRLRLRSADGSLRWFQVRMRAAGDGTAAPSRLSGSLRELDTDAAPHQAKATFLAHMSHELRTPLNAVLGMTELAQRLATHNEQRGYLELAQQSGQSLLRLIGDVIDYARAEAGELALRLETFDLSQLLAETFRGFMPQVHGRSLTMLYDYLGEQTQFQGDPARVRQIVSNLLANAVKFTAHGHVALVTELRAQPDGPWLLRIRVHDTGTGMDAATLERVFRPFEQGDNSARRQHGGTGLGLSLACKLAALMGGRVTATSVPGRGSVFSVELRLAAAAQPAPAPHAPGHAWLVVRNATTSPWLPRRIERLGWTTELIPDLAQATRRAQLGGRAPDCIVLAEDGLDDHSDLEALRRALPDSTRVTLLLRPDFHQPVLLERAARSRMAVLLKPLTPAELRTVASAETRSVPARVEPSTAMRPGMHVLVVEDNPLNQLVAREMLMVLGMKVSVAASGEEALAHCLQKEPDLVLMDIQMPGMDGVEATRRLRAMQADGTLRPFPIVALTAHALAADRQSSLDAGMDEHLTKPMQFESLRTVLDQWRPDDRGPTSGERDGDTADDEDAPTAN
jgi:signal transduction histidine kinase/CheY-like chemotaxis protein